MRHLLLAAAAAAAPIEAADRAATDPFAVPDRKETY
jgi:hypothetical protein